MNEKFDKIFVKNENEMHFPFNDNIFYSKQAELGSIYFGNINWEQYSDEDKQIIEKLFYDNFEKYNFYIRDINLTNDVARNYRIGDVLYNPSELYLTSKKVGLNKSYRFLIVSNRIDNLSFDVDGTIAEKESSIGLCVTDVAECFKVIDVYVKDGQTQITLLNIPEMFEPLVKSHQTDLEKELIPKTRKYFDEAVNNSFLEELDSDDWKHYFTDPVGICKYVENFEPYSKEQTLTFLGILGSIEQEFGIDIAIEFINTYDCNFLITVIDREVVKQLDKDKYASENEKQDNYDKLMNEHHNIIFATIKKQLLNQNLNVEEQKFYDKWIVNENSYVDYLN